jgi:hypothetical protein
MTQHRIHHGTAVIEYELIRSRRKTLGIIVRPDKSVTVRAPLRASTADIEAVLRKKAGWIAKKLQMFEDYVPPLPPRRYISGETHLYLGRPYRLKVAEAQKQNVTLQDSHFLLHVRDASDRERKCKLMTEWYRGRARQIFAERLNACYPRAAQYGIPFPHMKIRLMKRRWGSCSSKGWIQLNLRLIQTPQGAIDYVIFHELAHLQVPYHNKDFYALLDKMLPDWRAQREKLNKIQVA